MGIVNLEMWGRWRMENGEGRKWWVGYVCKVKMEL